LSTVIVLLQMANPSVLSPGWRQLPSDRRLDAVGGILRSSMRLATFIPPDHAEPRAGEVRGEEVHAFASGTVRDRLASGDLTPADGPAYPLGDVTLLAPVPAPRAIFGIGRNYAAHAAELGNVLPTKPLVFMKLPTSSVPPTGPIHCPAVVTELDYEAELVAVIGDGGRIAGWAVANDVSARDLQDSEEQWTRAKGFDTACPWGPWITTVDEIADARGLRIQSWVNGEQRQDANTQDLIFGPQVLVDFIAETCTLEPGDIILTGTPDGVGKAFNPPRYLGEGDVVRIEIERLGSIEHPVSAPG
jgi:2-keto-4-pentenoate hydratase/2-oxohepta-3-ene-1,7-dioic acid hydratase in catechol pathway